VTHDELIKRAVRWLRRSQKCRCVLAEPHTSSTSEIPDAIGWRLGKSIVIECKAGLSDFYSDRRKPSRKSGYGLGMLRYYLTAPGLLKNATLPKYWGVLECHPTLLRRVKIAVPVPNEDVDWISECAILASQWPWKSWKEEE